jgi:hypothetical protein
MAELGQEVSEVFTVDILPDIGIRSKLPGDSNVVSES